MRIGYKKVWIYARGARDIPIILKLQILGPTICPNLGNPDEKCRTSKVKVLSAARCSGRKAPKGVLRSEYRYTFTYEVGKTRATKLDLNPMFPCRPGIHFFKTRKQAVNY